MIDDREDKPSCSDLHRFVACPGYSQLKAKHGRDKSSASSRFGDGVHAALAQPPEVDGVPLIEYQTRIVSQCNKIRERLVAELFGDVKVSNIVETRFWAKDTITYQKVFSGRADLVVLGAGKALVVDFKSLPGNVDPVQSNWQIAGLAICLLDAIESGDVDYLNQPEIETVYGAIIQPSVSKEPPVVAYTPNQIYNTKLMVMQRLRESGIIGAPRIPGSHCKDCPVADHCVETQAMGMVLAKLSSKDIIEGLTPAQLCEILPRISAIRSTCNAILDRAKFIEKEAPGTLGGYQLVDRPGDRALVDLKGARDAVSERVTPAEFSSLLAMSIGALRDMYAQRTNELSGGTVTKKDAGIEFDKLIEPYVVRGNPQQTLTPVK